MRVYAVPDAFLKILTWSSPTKDKWARYGLDPFRPKKHALDTKHGPTYIVHTTYIFRYE